ncbi:MAG: CRISPR associated protein Cas6 [Smithella sp. PtaU1.Bin162]|nr:MAG: CRISPR associated protein Cas6 [Smithella sp. PtaU1.Bin162]
MQLEIKLKTKKDAIIKFDYLYEMHSALMSKIMNYNPDMAKELHEGKHKNRIKLFVFSPLNSMPNPRLVDIEGEKRKRMMLGERLWFRIASPIPEFLNTLGEAILSARTLSFGDNDFNVTGVNIVAPPEFKEEMIWRSFGQSASICTTWSPRSSEKKLFIYPDTTPEGSPDCAKLLAANLHHKFLRLNEIRDDIAKSWLADAGLKELPPEECIRIEFLPLSDKQEYRTIMHYGKSSAIKSWRCPVKVKAPVPIQRLIRVAGLGSLNSQGYGLVEEGKSC